MRFQCTRLLDRNDLQRIAQDLETESNVFANKASLDVFGLPTAIRGRENKAKELARFLLSYKKGHVFPFISVYGRSGSGKSTVVRFVCENLSSDISTCFVNLRKAKTVFGCANLILAELGEPNLKSAQGINVAIEQISRGIRSRLTDKGELFVLVLDEFDVLFNDKRGKPSDFIYKLLVMEENLRQKGNLVCIVAISNNVMVDYEIDDRVKSRIGTSEIFFNGYSKQDVLDILKDRAASAFNKQVDPHVLEYCAELSASEHGDARRAIDLLRMAGELAGSKGQMVLEKKHVDLAAGQLQKDRIDTVLSGASHHLKLACVSLARITFLTGQDWHSTSTLYKQYRIIRGSNKQLTYRRVSELFTELENTGIMVSQTSSRGRHGYGTQYKLTVSPEMIGEVCFPDWWKKLVDRKKTQEELEAQRKTERKSLAKTGYMPLLDSLEQHEKKEWNDFVGSDRLL